MHDGTRPKTSNKTTRRGERNLDRPCKDSASSNEDDWTRTLKEIATNSNATIHFHATISLSDNFESSSLVQVRSISSSSSLVHSCRALLFCGAVFHF